MQLHAIQTNKKKKKFIKKKIYIFFLIPLLNFNFFFFGQINKHTASLALFFA